MQKEPIIRYFLSFCFMLSGVLKAISIRAFEQEVQMYGEAYMGEWIHNYAIVVAVAVCMIEIVLSALVLLRRMRMIAFIAFCAMLSFFVYLTGMNYFFPSILGSIESCGCFGELIHFSPLASFVKSLLLWVVSILGIWICRKSADCK